MVPILKVAYVNPRDLCIKKLNQLNQSTQEICKYGHSDSLKREKQILDNTSQKSSPKFFTMDLKEKWRGAEVEQRERGVLTLILSPATCRAPPAAASLAPCTTETPHHNKQLPLSCRSKKIGRTLMDLITHKTTYINTVNVDKQICS
jgi:hypothetical protein